MKPIKATRTEKNGSITIAATAICLMGLLFGLDNFIIGLFPSGIDQMDRQLINSVAAILLLLILWLLASSGKLAEKVVIPLGLDSVRTSIVICFALFFLNFLLLEFRINELPFISPLAQNRLILILLMVSVFLLVIEFVFAWSRFSYLVLLLGIVAYGTLVWLEILKIPWLFSTENNYIGAMDAIGRFFIGLDPYQVFDESTDGPFTQLPGFWLQFFPAWLMEYDPRWINKIAFILSLLLVFLSTEKPQKLPVAHLLCVFMLIPFNISDNSTYLGSLAFASALTYFFFAKRLYLLGAAAIGWSLTISLYFWLIIPFALVFLFRKQPFLLWLLETVIVALFASTLLVSFWWMYPESFLYCTVEVWGDTVMRNGFNIAFMMEQLVGRYGMIFLQVVSFLAFFMSFLKSQKSLSGFLIYSGLFAYLCVILNHVVNNYIFPVICLMIIAGITADGLPASNQKKQCDRVLN
ncbi:hypothetical protein KJ966_05765 [bacterium]|nr:hypothetical protein [bacterium]